MSTQPDPDALAILVSARLREWIHDVNNALFVTKGFLEEIRSELDEKAYTKASFDHENFADMLLTVARNVDKMDLNLQKLRKFAKDEIFELSDAQKPSKQ